MRFLEFNSWNASSVDREAPEIRKLFDVPFIIVTMNNGKSMIAMSFKSNNSIRN